MDPRPARRARPCLRRAATDPERAASVDGHAAAVPGRLRPGHARQLHRERDRRCYRVRPVEAEAVRLHAIATFHLLQRARHRGHGGLRQRRTDTRRHQDRGEPGRVPRTRLALRHNEVHAEAAGEGVHRCRGRSRGLVPEPDPGLEPDEGLPRIGLSVCVWVHRLRKLRRFDSRAHRACTDAGSKRAGDRRPCRDGGGIRGCEPVVPGAQLVGCRVGHGRLFHHAVRVPHPVRLVFGLLDDPHRRPVTGQVAVAVLFIAGIVVGVAGRFWRSIRVLLVGLAPLGSAAIVLYFIFEGSVSQCAGTGATFHCWETSYASAMIGNGDAVAGVAIATLLSLAPIASAWIGRPGPSSFAVIALPLLVLGLFLYLGPWFFIWPALIAAATSGPPTRRASLTFSRPTDDTPK